MKKIIPAISVILILCSCNDSISISEGKGEKKSAIVAGSENEEVLSNSLSDIAKAEKKREKEELASHTTLSFNEMLHDYGNVKPDSDNTAFFIVTNTGKKPLIIESVDASCGCTTPMKPEKPILPGKSDKIKVVFHPKPGQIGDQNKKVTVTANTDPRLTVLKIKAFVK